jgi:glycine hydroxymethyltransferase
MHVIAAKAVAFHEALQPSFRAYQAQIVANARALADELTALGFRLVAGGTDTHLLLVDLGPLGITGKEAETLLDEAGIIANKNAIPYDPQPPAVTSGIRLGTPALTTRGMREAEMHTVARLIHRILSSRGDAAVLQEVRRSVADLAAGFPLYAERLASYAG